MNKIFPLINVGFFPRKVTMNGFIKNMLMINNCLDLCQVLLIITSWG